MNTFPEELEKLIESSAHWSNEAWVNMDEDCYGIKIKNMNLNHLMILDGVDTPFLRGGDITDQDVALFLWIVSKEFSLNEKAKKTFFKKVIQINNFLAIKWIKEYIKKTFSEADTMKHGDKGQTYFLSYFVDIFAREYSWSFDSILKLPLRIGFQLITAINERNSKSNGETYQRVTELDNSINRFVLKGEL